MLPKAILFDLDDTLVSFDQHSRPAWQTTCRVFAPEAGVSPERLHEAIHDVAQAYWSDPERHRAGRLELEETRRVIVTQALEKLEIRNNALACRIADHYSSLQENMIDLFPDTLPTLDFFKRKKIPMALVTNGNALMQRRKIERFGLTAYFPHLFIEGELGFGKPDQRVFTAALQALGASSNETWCVGDNLEWDIQGAQACGIRGIWKDVKRKGPGENGVKPDRIIFELSELCDLWGTSKNSFNKMIFSRFPSEQSIIPYYIKK